MTLDRRLVAGGVYLILLLASFVVRQTQGPPTLPAGTRSLQVAAQCADGPCGRRQVRLVYEDVAARSGADAPVLLLLHGSPGSRHDFDGMQPILRERYRLIVPDLPGFGASSRRVPDYSVQAHARYAAILLEELGIDSAHLVGFSMGGGVALELAEEDLDVRSLTLLAAIGVQELELLGSYRLNHFVHAGQLATIWLATEGLPHFGLLDRFPLNVPYARNFYDTDQRPLRAILEGLQMPVRIQHGEGDFLVPPQAAREHHRIVPHSELDLYDADHFMLFTEPTRSAERLIDFLDRVERGEAPVRGEATPERLARAALPFDSSVMPAASGLALFVIGFLIVVATFVSEDLACIGAGLLVAQGRLDYTSAVVACFIGIFVGDVVLYLAGRWLGAAALARAPLRWLITPSQVRFAADWLQRRGLIVIVLSRFIPGTRLPTFFTAGSLRTNLLAFSLYFGFAVAIWTPLLVLFAMKLGDAAFERFHELQRNALWAMALLALAILLLVKILIPMLSHRGRRRLVGSWRRWTRWEFWPGWLFYPPVVAYVLWRGLRHRSPLLFTASNPAIPTGGFVRESKSQILDGLTADPRNRPFVADYLFLPTGEERLETATRWVESYPVVAKPDAGQRGSGVAIVRDPPELADVLEAADYDLLLQRYVTGEEYGLFYARHPEEERGRIISITVKRMPHVEGDGRRTVEQLILDDPRAVVMARHYVRALGQQAFRVPEAGERVQLIDIGTHCRGAIFLDGAELNTPELERAVDAVSGRYDGFFFGRYDVRTPDAAALGRGEFTVLELNGVTSEATHIYDPRHSLVEAWGTLCRQWALAFEVGAANCKNGTRPINLRRLFDDLDAYRRTARRHIR